MSDQVVFASSDVTVHKSQGFTETQNGGKVELVEAVVLRAGDTFPVSQLAEYQQKALEEGNLAGVEVVSQDEADKRSAELSKLRASVQTGNVRVSTVGLTGPDADDGSFSDHLVSDAERVANHAARGAAEAGEAGGDGKVTVAGADAPNSPANSGVTTKSDVSDEVQGSGGKEAAQKGVSTKDTKE